MSQAGLPFPQAIAGRSFDQLGIVVEELESAIRAWSPMAGSDWAVYTYGPHNLSSQSYRGASADFTMRIALTSHAPQVELIQPIAGPSHYHEWVAARGYGLHHLGYWVEDAQAATESMVQAGFEVIQSGRGFGLDGDGAFVYFDWPGVECAVLELIERPARRIPREALGSAH